MANTKHESKTVFFPRWLIALALVIFIPLAASFNARLVTIRQMRQEEAQLKQDIAIEEERRTALQATHTYVKSDAYVEHWARVEARMAYPGEVAVIPVAQQAIPVATPAPLAAAKHPASPIDEWWDLFFGPPTATP